MLNRNLVKSKISQARKDLTSLEIDNLEKQKYIQEIKELLKQNNACLVAHYYVDAQIQELAEATGGFVGDSLAMARFGLDSDCDMLVVAGVRFMGESAKILSPNKKVIMPTLQAECSLDLSCSNNQFEKFVRAHPDREVVVYVNTSAQIKALADWTVTSSNALGICLHLHKQGKKILWGPDKFLGDWLQKQIGADMILYDGSCIVHEEFKAQALDNLILEYPDAAVLVHPESPAWIIKRAGIVGSTSELIAASYNMNNDKFIVATDIGVFYKMKQLSPSKEFIPAPTANRGGTCHSCAKCPWMKLNQLKNLRNCLLEQTNQIIIKQDIRKKALTPLMRMINF